MRNYLVKIGEMKSHSLFREIPPWTLVIEILKLLKLPTEPPFTFQKDVIDLNQSVDAEYILEPYYIPCKAKQFLGYTDAKRWITILRHILLPHGWVVLTQETTRDRKKVIFYTVDRISVIEGPLRQPVKIDFS
jgi:hypothetical protein